jgi:hypothetical protein
MGLSRLSIYSFVLLATFTPVGVQAASKTYSCTAVDKKAAVGVDSARSVSVSTGDRACFFSVDSAPVDSRYQQEFVRGINELIAGRLDNLSPSSNNREAIRQMLLPQSSDDFNLRIAFENAFNTNLMDFGNCIRQFRAGQRPNPRVQQNLVCGTATGSNTDPMSRRHPVFVEGDGADVLELGVVLNGKGYYLFVPNELLQRGIQGFQFRPPG